MDYITTDLFAKCIVLYTDYVNSLVHTTSCTALYTNYTMYARLDV